MIRRLVILILIWICFILQTSALPMAEFLSATPNLLLIITVSMGFLRGHREGIIFGFICGIILDLFYGNIIGLYALLYMYSGFFAGMFNNVYYEDRLTVPMIIVFINDIICNVFIYIGGFFLRGKLYFGTYFIKVMIPEAVITAVVALLLYKIIYEINKALSKDEVFSRRHKWLKG